MNADQPFENVCSDDRRGDRIGLLRIQSGNFVRHGENEFSLCGWGGNGQAEECEEAEEDGGENVVQRFSHG